VDVVDSSGWLEYFSGASNAGFFEEAITDAAHLLVPTVIVYEVLERVLSSKGERAATTALSILRKARIVDMDERIAVMAARIGVAEGLPMADSIILATARHGRSMPSSGRRTRTSRGSRACGT
jgi:predicted nucleic acid-binding protein